MRCIYTLIFLFAVSISVVAQGGEDWRSKTLLLVYSPRYFGPTAFPIPELRSGKLTSQFEIEVRGEYHNYVGDQTKDLFLRALIPIVKERAGIEVRLVALEHYKLTPETRDERNAVSVEAPSSQSYSGDVVVSAFYQLWKSEKWFDVMFSMNIKTASGGRLCDARFTDAAAYWFDATAGKDILKSKNGKYIMRIQVMAGFYCWMTNNMIHRQDDAASYGVGLAGILGKFSLSSDLSGFSGYRNNGDHPLVWRNNMQFEYRNNVLSIRYDHGMKDSLYDTYSAGYIRKF
jgi:hypothetical protein